MAYDSLYAMQGYTEVAEIDTEVIEPEETIRQDIPDGYRMVSVYPGDHTIIETETDDSGRWVKFATITHDAAFEVGEEMAEKFESDLFRVVYDWNVSELYVEYFVEE